MPIVFIWDDETGFWIDETVNIKEKKFLLPKYLSPDFNRERGTVSTVLMDFEA